MLASRIPNELFGSYLYLSLSSFNSIYLKGEKSSSQMYRRKCLAFVRVLRHYGCTTFFAKRPQKQNPTILKYLPF